MERLILSPQTEIFSRKRDFFKDRPKFPNGISKWKMCVLFASFYHFQVFWLDCLWSYLPRKSLGNGTSASPCKNFHSEFDASHLLQLSTNRFFPVNDKQRQLREPFQSHSPLNYYQMSPSKFDSNRYMFGKPFKNRRARHQQRGTGGV